MSDRSLRLGLVGPIPPPSGGMANQTRQLRELLTQEGVVVEFLATNPAYRPAFIGSVKGLRALFRLVPYIFSAWRLAGRVDVIHMMANSGWSWQLYSAPVVWAGWLRNTPVIVNYRGGEALSYFRESFHRVKPTLDKAFCIAVPSKFLQEVFGEYGVATSVIPNIIDLNRFRPIQRPEKSCEFRLVVTRNLESIYGIDTAIKSVALIAEKVPGLRLMIAGSGPQLAELQTLVRATGLENHVDFLGRLTPEEVGSLYHQADVMLNPTTVDNMPNSVLEALASGVPVISSNVGGVPFIVENEKTALLVPSGDEHSMAEAIVRLYRDTELRSSLAAAGLAEVQQYAWPMVRHKWQSVYRSAIRGVMA